MGPVSEIVTVVADRSEAPCCNLQCFAESTVNYSDPPDTTDISCWVLVVGGFSCNLE